MGSREGEKEGGREGSREGESKREGSKIHKFLQDIKIIIIIIVTGKEQKE